MPTLTHRLGLRRWASLGQGIARSYSSVAAFALDVGAAERTVEAWLRGERRPPLSRLDVIAQKIGATRAELVADCPGLFLPESTQIVDTTTQIV